MVIVLSIDNILHMRSIIVLTGIPAHHASGKHQCIQKTNSNLRIKYLMAIITWLRLRPDGTTIQYRIKLTTPKKAHPFGFILTCYLLKGKDDIVLLSLFEDREFLVHRIRFGKHSIDIA